MSSLRPLKYSVAQILEPRSLLCQHFYFLSNLIVSHSNTLRHDYILVSVPERVFHISTDIQDQLRLTSLFSDPREPHVRSSHSTKRPGFKSSGSSQQLLPKRDLATKYFGEHLFTLPVSVAVSDSGLSTNKTRRKR